MSKILIIIFVLGVSLCLNEYADHFKLGVMCDAQLAPNHPFLARGFPQYIKNLANAVCYRKQ